MTYWERLETMVSRHIIGGDLVAGFDGWNSVWEDYGGSYAGKSFTNYTVC